MADPGLQSPLIDFFRRGEVARDVRLLAAQGALAPRAQEQIALLVLLVGRSRSGHQARDGATLDALPPEPLRAFPRARGHADGIATFFAALGIEVPAGAPAAADVDFDEPLLDTLVGAAARRSGPDPADPRAQASCRPCRCSIA